MNAYIYCADLYCEDCGRLICEQITAAGDAPADPSDEYSYDSDDYPKFAPDGGGPSDTVWHCGNDKDCVNAITLKDGTKIGCMLENDLTEEGREYVRQSIAEYREQGIGIGEVVALWANFYDIPMEDTDTD